MNSIFEYTLRSLNRFGLKNFSIGFIFTLLVWLLSSAMFITSSINEELKSLASNTPDILIKKQIAGKSYFLDESDIDPLLEIPGISNASGRVWGSYYLEFKKTHISIVGLNDYGESFQKDIEKIAQVAMMKDDENYAFMSKSMYKFLKEYRLGKDKVFFEKFGGGNIQLHIDGTFKSKSELLSNDVVLMSEKNARKVLGIPSGKYSDIYVKVPNPNEVAFISAKIAHQNPSFQVTTKDEIVKDFELLYEYKSGWFLLLYIISFFTFATILYDKASGLRGEEKRELGLLKALGWEINHIIYFKILEALIISLSAFLLGLMLALFFVYVLQAPGLKYVFIGYSHLKQPLYLSFSVNIKLLFLLFFTTIPLYVAVSIIPAWKAASIDAGEILR